MTNKLSKKALIRIIAFTVAIVLVFAGSAISGYALVSRYKSTIEYSYQRALSELSDYISNLQATLTKGLYAGTATTRQAVAVKLISCSEGAKSALGQLPVSQSEGANLQKYLAQVGDVAMFLNSKLSRGEELSEDNLNLIKELSKYADKIAPQIEQLSAIFNDTENPIGSQVNISSNLESVTRVLEQLNLDSGFREMNEGFVDYPSLVYDGPFADHILQKTPSLTQYSEELSKNDCTQLCASFLGVRSDYVKFQTSREGNMPVYDFKYNNTFVSITKAGGYVEEMRNDRMVSNNKLTYSQALESAKSFLESHELFNMKESYYVIQNNVCTINFAYTQDDVICYSDLIKIGVALDNGEIVNYNASGYIMNHKERSLPQPQITVSQGQNSLSDSLTVESTGIALIPQGGETELLCYEYTCKGTNDDRVLVYVNCETGLEEQILILLQWDGGTLVM